MSRLYFNCARLLMMLGLVFTLVHPSTAAAVKSAQQGDILTLENDAIRAIWTVHGGALRWQSFTNQFTGIALPLDNAFEFVPKEGSVLRSSDFKMLAPPAIEEIPAAMRSSKAADRVPGRQIRIELEDSSGKIRVTWKAILREDANYVRQEVTVHAADQPFALAQIGLVDAVVPGADSLRPCKGITSHRRNLVFCFRTSALRLSCAR